MIRELIVQYLVGRPKRVNSPNYVPKLWPSEVGGCGRKAMLRVAGAESKEFNLTVLEAMNNGVAFEDDTAKALQAMIKSGALRTQVPLVTPFWSGKIDFVIDTTDGLIIIEHKATGDKWWNYQGNLPKLEHVAQVALYLHLYPMVYNVTPAKGILYYRSWGHYAEFVITIEGDKCIAEGLMDGVPIRKEIDFNAADVIEKLEYHYTTKRIPARYKTPIEGQCIFKGQPSCGVYDLCWPVQKEFHAGK